MKKIYTVLLPLLGLFFIHSNAFSQSNIFDLSEKSEKVAYTDTWEEESVVDLQGTLPFKKPRIISLNTRVSIPSSVGVIMTYDETLFPWLGAGIGFGFANGGAPTFADIPFYQFNLPLYLNLYALSSPHYNHRWLFYFSLEPFIEIDRFHSCEALNSTCNPVPKKTYGGVYFGGGTGYEYRNEDGFVARLMMLALIPVPNPKIKYKVPKSDPSYIHYAVIPALQFSLGYSF